MLLLLLPPGAFNAIVPVLIASRSCSWCCSRGWPASCASAGRPRRRKNGARNEHHYKRRNRARSGHRHNRKNKEKRRDSWPLWLGVLATGIYGGYFGAAQGVLLLGLMGVLLTESLQRINAVKNVLAMLANLASGIVFVFVAHVAWPAVLLVAAGPRSAASWARGSAGSCRRSCCAA